MSGLTDARRRRKPGGPAEGLPDLPRMRTASDYRKRHRVTLTIPAKTDIAPARGATWGSTLDGCYVGGGEVRDILGKCEQCGQLVRAWHLIYKQLPFGRGERRQCRGGCA